MSSKGILTPPKGFNRYAPKRQGIKRPVSTLKSGSVRDPIKPAFRSKLEERGAAQIEAHGLDHNYETKVLPFVVPSRKARYTPDFPIGSKPIYLEFKGRFRTAAERQKMILVRDQTPGVDIRFVFQNANLPIYKNSPTSHSKWAEDHGFMWCDKGVIPEHWLKEAHA